MRASTLTHVLHRLLAGFGVALVLALTVFAASPQLHSWLHADTAAGDDDCPVAVFAGALFCPGKSPDGARAGDRVESAGIRFSR